MQAEPAGIGVLAYIAGAELNRLGGYRKLVHSRSAGITPGSVLALGSGARSGLEAVIDLHRQLDFGSLARAGRPAQHILTQGHVGRAAQESRTEVH